MLFKTRTFENFAELRYNIAAGAVIFQCTLTLLPTYNNSLYSRPVNVARPLQPLTHNVLQYLVLGVMLSSQVF